MPTTPAIPVICAPDLEELMFPMALAAWHQTGGRIAFALGEARFSQFTAADAEALYAVRNHPSVLPYMPAAQAITYQRHLAWVESNLLIRHKDTPLIVLGRLAGQEIGFGILKPKADAETLEIGVIVTDRVQCHALPLQLGGALIAIAAQLFGARTLVSYVNRQHRHALRLNRGVGLVQAEHSDKEGELLFRASIEHATGTRIYRHCTRDLTLNLLPAAP